MTGADRYPFPISTVIRLLFLTPSQGALTSLFALTAPVVRAESGTYKGSYLVPFGKVEQASVLADDVEVAKQLWEMSSKILSEGGLK